MKINKTNALRALDTAKIPYTIHTFDSKTALSAVEVATAIAEPPAKIYKTLVTAGKSGAHYVFVIPGAAELDLKKAARLADEKSIAMLPSKDLLKLTGYVHGGCSPVGMKTLFTTYIDASASSLPTFIVSAGKIGLQMELDPQSLAKLIKASFGEVTTLSLIHI